MGDEASDVTPILKLTLKFLNININAMAFLPFEPLIVVNDRRIINLDHFYAFALAHTQSLAADLFECGNFMLFFLG